MGMFTKAHKFTAKWEGGLVDHPADTGGITNHGVSLRWLRDQGVDAGDIDGDGDIDADDIRELTAAQAAALFRERFWDPLRCDDYAQPVALALYDAAVNCGPAQAVRFAQRAVNAMGGQLDVDGKLGALTRAELIVMGGDDDGYALASAICDQREAFYRRLAESKPPLGVFLGGWLNRVKSLRKELGK